MVGNVVDSGDTEPMLAAVVACALALLVAIGFLIERHGRGHASATTSVLLEQQRNACAASYLRESITASLVTDDHHPGHSGRRR